MQIRVGHEIFYNFPRVSNSEAAIGQRVAHLVKDYDGKRCGDQC
jgi:hypothetical protein